MVGGISRRPHPKSRERRLRSQASPRCRIRIRRLRRQAIAFVLGALAKSEAGAHGSLARFLDPANGAAVLLDVQTRRVIAVNDGSVADTFLAPLGSTIKPFVLSALLRWGKLGP